MRAPLPYLLSLLLLAAPVAANRNVRGNTGRTATPGTGAATAARAGVPTITGLNSVLTPVTTPVLAPAIDPSRLTAPNETAQLVSAPADAPRTTLPAADAPRSDAPGATGPLPAFARAMLDAGAPQELVDRLYALLSRGHPGDQTAVYHGLIHSQDVAGVIARLTAAVFEGEAALTDAQKILIILAASLHDLDPLRAPGMPPTVQATVAYLEQNAEARDLVAEFGARFGFTPAQVTALIKATDFSPVPTRLAELHLEFEAAANASFGAQGAWARTWGYRIALADKTAAYMGDRRSALTFVRGLANEFRAAAAASGGNAAPLSAESIVANTHSFLERLPILGGFEKLPADLRAAFGDNLTYFRTLKDPGAAAEALRSLDAAPPRGPPARVILDLAAANRYINSIAGGLKLKEGQRAALFEQWLEEKGIPAGSERALAVKRELLPSAAASDAAALEGVSPRLAAYHGSLLKLAREQNTTPVAISRALEAAGIVGDLGGLSAETFENQAWLTMRRASLERAVRRYPNGPQGVFMRQVASAMSAPGGKSVEEVAREGVFAQVTFTSDGATAVADRNPDNTTAEMVFYITRREEKWRVEGYRRNSGSASDAASKQRFIRWLVAGGIPAADFE